MRNFTIHVLCLCVSVLTGHTAISEESQNVLPLPLSRGDKRTADRYLYENIAHYVATTSRIQNISNCETDTIDGGTQGLEGSDLNFAIYQYCVVAGAQYLKSDPVDRFRAAFLLLRSQGIASGLLAHEAYISLTQEEKDTLASKDFLYSYAESIGQVEELGGNFNNYAVEQICLPVWGYDLDIDWSQEYKEFCSIYFK